MLFTQKSLYRKIFENAENFMSWIIMKIEWNKKKRIVYE